MATEEQTPVDIDQTIRDSLAKIQHGDTCCAGCRLLNEEAVRILTKLDSALGAIQERGIGGLLRDAMRRKPKGD